MLLYLWSKTVKFWEYKSKTYHVKRTDFFQTLDNLNKLLPSSAIVTGCVKQGSGFTKTGDGYIIEIALSGFYKVFFLVVGVWFRFNKSGN